MDEQNVTQIEEQEQKNPTTELEEAVADELKDKISETLEKIRTQNMLLGARAMTVTIAGIIDNAMNAPGKRTMADMKRLVKKVRDFCQKAIDHPVEEPKFDTNNEEETDA
nr:MAG TPA: hypothetical protein [Caudoviricetes sp.]